MNRVASSIFRVAMIATFLLSGVSRVQAQDAPPSGAQAPAGAPAAKPDAAPQNPFASQPAPPLPAGMTGSDTNDPRYKLTPGSTTPVKRRWASSICSS